MLQISWQRPAAAATSPGSGSGPSSSSGANTTTTTDPGQHPASDLPHNTGHTFSRGTLPIHYAPATAGTTTVMSSPGTNHAQATTTSDNNPTSAATHRIRLVRHLDTRRSLRFDPICRDLREGDPALRIRHFTDRSGLELSATNSFNFDKLACGSEVVPRAHTKIWVEAGGKLYIRDTRLSSGTPLNHVRLSVANMESRPF
ncbi:hypothetical protein P691DRAFT_481437 [Macrolepiota fuliginosa MF-IS2]|uniref:FHA domain-containing protein n=1 Tax=Macrolepiota fuliginosa MF-IS2 TaxID=1400762 RepID=A0A9P5X196_9AGAR|nr:hypothetical protein P691DRAFT_481437 [Macrolepiota fuliginosa MF-IS2]